MENTTTSLPAKNILKDTETEIPEPQQSFLKKWGSLVILSLALAIIVIDTTLLNVSLGNIIRDLHTDIQSLQWVITAYSLTLAALTVTGGRIGDLWGRKKMFMIGAIIFAAGSFLASISESFEMLLIGESIIEGIGAALMMPATSSLLIANFKGRDRAIAFGIWGGIAAGASAIGPILGGFLATNYSWRWGFRINVFVTIILLLGSFLIHAPHVRKQKAGLDFIGVLLSSLGLLSVVFGFIESTTYGWIKAKEVFSIFGQSLDFGGISIVPFALALGVLLLTLFCWWEIKLENRGKEPLVSMKLFKNRQFSSGMLTTGILSLGQAGIIFSIPVFLQSVRGLDAYNTGLALLPLSLTLLVFAPLSAFLSKKIPPKLLIQIGLFLDFIAMIVLRQSFHVDADASTFAPGLMLYGAGMGMIMSQISNISLSAVSAEQAGQASGVNNTVRQIGSSLGSAIIGAVLLTSLSLNLSAGVNENAHIPSILKPYLDKTISSQTSNIEFNGGAKIKLNLPASILQDIQGIGKQAITDANKSALIYASVFAFLGFLVSFMLPNAKKSTTGEPTLAAGH